MFNVTGGELVIILLVALIVLGPEKLPDAIRKFGRVYGELRRMSSGFQSELRDALDEPLREVRDTMNTVKGGFQFDDGDRPTAATPSEGPRPPPDEHAASTDETDGAPLNATGAPNGAAATPGTNGTNGAAPTETADVPTSDEPVGPSDPD